MKFLGGERPLKSLGTLEILDSAEVFALVSKSFYRQLTVASERFLLNRERFSSIISNKCSFTELLVPSSAEVGVALTVLTAVAFDCICIGIMKCLILKTLQYYPLFHYFGEVC